MKTGNPYLQVPRLPETMEVDLSSLLSGRRGPVELEIGFGKGHFLLGRAQADPGMAILGVETRRKLVHLVSERIQKHRIPNAAVYHGDAREALDRLRPHASVRRIFINFPDPWWKVRHEKRMVICPELMAAVNRLLEDGGDLFVQTDVDFRAARYKQIIEETPGLTPAFRGDFAEDNPFEARSLREQKAIETGLPVFRLHYRRDPRRGSREPESAARAR